MNRRLESVLSTLIAGSAVVVAGVSVSQYLSVKPTRLRQPPRFELNWDQLLHGGTRIGPSTAPVQIVEFGDFECPFCRFFHTAAEETLNEFPDHVALIHYNFPLPIHRFAEAAARTAVCAAEVGQFPEMAKELYAKQDSFGKKSWGSFAQSAGIVDTTELVRCTKEPRTEAKVKADLVLAGEFSVTATPTVIVNGWRFSLAPTDSLRHIVQEVILGRDPFSRR